MKERHGQFSAASRQVFKNCRLLLPDGGLVPGALSICDGVIEHVDANPSRPGGREEDGAIHDLGGRVLAPGFVDAHTHLTTIALEGLRCDLGGAGSPEEVYERLSGWGASHLAEEVVVGAGWDDSNWADGRRLTRRGLDAIDARRPVFARRVCGHAGVVNALLLNQLADLGRFVDRDTGVIAEDAVYEANRLTRPPGVKVTASIEPAIRRLHALGITGIHDIISPRDIDAYLEGVRASAAPIRIDGFARVDPREYAGLAELTAGIDEGRFRLAGLKLFADGSFGGHTAALHSSYSDERTIGEFLLDEETLADTLRRCCDSGVTCAVHAIGDRALRAVLLAMAKFPSDTDLFRVEHAELAGWDEVRLLEYAPVYLSMQPNFVRNWQSAGGLYETRLGRDRWSRCNRFRTLADAGIPYMFGSDAMPPGPLYGVRGATHHPVPQERLGLAEALLCYSARAAALGACPRNAGELVSGRVADLVVISGDFEAGDPALLGIDQTWVGGRLVFCGEGPNPSDPA